VVPGVDGGSPEREAGGPAPLPGRHLFSRSFGSPDDEFLSHGTVDLLGNLFLAGSVEGSIDFGGAPLVSAGALDMFFAKLGPAGEHVFSQRYGDAAEQSGLDLIAAGRDVFALGIFRSSITVGPATLTNAEGPFDAVLLRLTSDGLYDNHFQLGGPGLQLLTGLAHDGARGAFVTGYNQGTVTHPQATTTAGASDVFTAHVLSTQDWSRGFGDTGDQYGDTAAFDPRGFLVTAGYFGGGLDFGGGSRTSAGGVDIFVTKQDLSGAHLWSLRFGDLGDQRAEAIALDSQGNIFLTGRFAGSFDFGGDRLESAGATDFYVVKLDETGKHVWSKRFGGPGEEVPNAIALDGAGNVLVVGRAYGPLDFGSGNLPPAGDSDAFVVKLDPTGNHLWSKRFGDVGLDSANAIGATPTNEVWVAGYFRGTVDFGGGPLTSKGKADVFVARFAP
jgi:hypothetical protein